MSLKLKYRLKYLNSLYTVCFIVLSVILFSCGATDSSSSSAKTETIPNALSAESAVFAETARFLAGEQISESSKLAEFAKTKSYKKYAAELNSGWKRFQEPNLEKMENWWKQHAVKKPGDNILYPFSGPDIMNVLAFFPDGNTYTMFGLEPIGEIPNPQNMTTAQIEAGLAGIRQSLNTILQVNFFRTNSMAKELSNKSFNGITGLMMVFLTKKGYTVTDARKVTINADSVLVASEKSDEKIDWTKPPKSRVPGVEISFRKGNSKTQTVRYFMLNVIDQALADSSPNFIPYIAKNEPYSTFLKSASYLMHNDKVKFTKIRAAILQASSSIVQDDSGIPLRYFKENEWDISFHGVYDKPIPLFANRAQPDLKKLASEKSTGILPFSYGYDYKKDQSNLLVAEKKQ